MARFVQFLFRLDASVAMIKHLAGGLKKTHHELESRRNRGAISSVCLRFAIAWLQLHEVGHRLSPLRSV
jgi:hypothetical protein